jgi:hypothetical protein
MIHTVPFSGFVPHRRTRAFFFLRTAQHVRSRETMREIVRALLALAGAASWAAVLLLLSEG